MTGYLIGSLALLLAIRWRLSRGGYERWPVVTRWFVMVVSGVAVGGTLHVAVEWLRYVRDGGICVAGPIDRPERPCSFLTYLVPSSFALFGITVVSVPWMALWAGAWSSWSGFVSWRAAREGAARVAMLSLLRVVGATCVGAVSAVVVSGVALLVVRAVRLGWWAVRSALP